MSTEMTAALAKYIAEKILKNPKRQIKPDEALLSSGLIDSFSLVDLGMFVEDQFGVRLEDSELNKDTFDTLNQLVKVIQERQ